LFIARGRSDDPGDRESGDNGWSDLQTQRYPARFSSGKALSQGSYTIVGPFGLTDNFVRAWPARLARLPTRRATSIIEWT